MEQEDGKWRWTMEVEGGWSMEVEDDGDPRGHRV